MKTTAAGRSSLFFIAMLLFSLSFASSVSAAEEGALINAVIVKEGRAWKNIQVYTIRNSGGWALATLTYDDDNRATRGASALLKKSGTRWEFMQFSGKTPTTDLLKQNNVPPNAWGELIDGASAARTKPILDFLHAKYPKQSFESIEMSGDFALANWYGGEDSGMALLQRAGNSWKVLLSTGGVIDAGTLKRQSVPAQHIRPLLGVQ